MSSSYGVRLYELFAQWKKKKEVSFQWLKETLQVGNKYESMYEFKRRVLMPAIKDVNKNSDIWVKVDQKKTGRKVTHFIFEFGPKDKTKSKKESQPRLSGAKIFGVDKAIIEKKAKAGETYEQAALRIKKEKQKEPA